MIGPDSKSAVPALAGLLRDENSNVRLAAEYALARIGPSDEQATSELIEMLKQGKLAIPIAPAFYRNDKRIPGGQVCIVSSLGYLPPKTSRGTKTPPEPQGIFSTSQDFLKIEVEPKAANVFASLNEAAVPPLLAMLEGPQENLQDIAVSALSSIGVSAVKPLAGLLEDPRPDIREKAALALGLIGEDAATALPAVIAMLQSETPSGGHCRGCAAAAFALQRIGSKSIPMLLAVLSGDNANASLYAAYSLGEIKPKNEEVIDQLISALADSRKHVRASAALVLGALGPIAQRGVPVLNSAMTGSDPFDTIIAAAALEGIQPESDQGVKALVRLLRHEEPRIRRSAVEALEALGGKGSNACPALVQALADPNESVRNAAIAALQAIRFPSKEVLDGLWTTVRNSPRSRNAAALALGLHGEPAIPTLLPGLSDPDAVIRRWAAFGLGQIEKGTQSLPALIEALSDPFEFVRTEAAVSIGRIGQTWPNGNKSRPESPAASAVPSLIRCLTHSDAGPDLKEAVAEALAKIGGPRDQIEPRLMALLKDDSVKVRRSAALSLEWLGHLPKEALPVLEDVINDPNAEPWFRNRAAQLAQKLKSEKGD
jgi:HEAT repeat protein